MSKQVFWWIVAGIIFMGLGFSAKRDQEAAAVECAATDIECLGRKYKIDAQVKCLEPIERLAKNNFEWFNEWPQHPKFSQIRLGPRHDSITVIGDRIKFQNGFGAWIIHKYECDFDTKTKTALAVRAYPWN